MDGNGDIRARLDELSAMRAGDMSLGEIRAALREMSELDRQLSLGHARAAARPHVPPPLRAAMPMRAARRDRREERQRKLSELAVGRYALTALAAGLCLLALCAFLARYWAMLPGGLQWAIITAAGAGLWALGYKKSGKPAMRPFWLGLAALGAGACYIAVLGGMMLWQLYGILATGVLACAWCISGTLAARRRKAWIFYLVAYAGSAASVALADLMLASARVTAFGNAGPSPYGTAAVAVLAMAMGALGFWAAVTDGRGFPAACHLGWCGAVCWALDPEKGPAFVLCLAAVCGSALWIVRMLDPGEGAFRRPAVNAAYAFGAAALAEAVLGRSGVLGAACVLALIGAGCAGAAPGYLTGTLFVSCRLLAVLSNELLGWACVLPAAAAAIAMCGYFRAAGRDRFEQRLVLRVLWLFAYASALDAGEFDFAAGYLAAALFLAVAWCAWLVQSRARRIYDDEGLENLLAVLVPGALAWIPAVSGVLAPGLAAVACLASLQGWRVYSDNKNPGRRAMAAWRVLYIVSYGLVLARAYGFGYGEPGTAELVLILASFLGTTAFHAWDALERDDGWRSAIACGIAEWHMWAAAGLFGLDARMLALDVAGLLIAAAAVAAGFRFDKPGMRQAGLACAMIYGLKAGLVSAPAAGSGAVPGLLLAGGICFAMAWGYNALGRKYPAHRRGTEEDGGDGEDA